ncbi:GNAT family N-acetyltransferase [bacterium]|nr:GNAT family N-acetyltransferase [bacterium]
MSSICELRVEDLEKFLPLLAEIECGAHFDMANAEHVAFLRHRIEVYVAMGAQFFAARGDDGAPLGIVAVIVERKLHCAPSAEVVSIGTMAAHRRSGVGTELLNHAVDIARRAKAHAVFAKTYAADAGTIAFYGRNGFHPVAVIPGTNGPDDEGDAVMRKGLSESDS